MKVSSIFIININVIIKLHSKVIFKHIFSLNMKIKYNSVIIVSFALKDRIISCTILSLNMIVDLLDMLDMTC